MEKRQTLERREFTLAAALAMLSGVTITVASCGGGGSGGSPSAPSNPTPSTAPGDEAGSISANHGHTAVITAAQLAAGAALSVELTAGQGHTHTVSLTAGEVTQIAGGQRVSKASSSDDAHSHLVTFN